MRKTRANPLAAPSPEGERSEYICGGILALSSVCTTTWSHAGLGTSSNTPRTMTSSPGTVWWCRNNIDMPNSFPGGENRPHCGPLHLRSATPQPVPAQGLKLLQGHFTMQSRHLILLALQMHKRRIPCHLNALKVITRLLMTWFAAENSSW